MPPKKTAQSKGSIFDAYKDTKQKGLVMLVTNRGDKTFYLYMKVKGGKPERIKLRRFPDMTTEQAQKEAVKNRAIVISGKNPNEECKKLRNEMTFKTLFEEYMERYSKSNKQSWKYDEREINRFVAH